MKLRFPLLTSLFIISYSAVAQVEINNFILMGQETGLPGNQLAVQD